MISMKKTSEVLSSSRGEVCRSCQAIYHNSNTCLRQLVFLLHKNGMTSLDHFSKKNKMPRSLLRTGLNAQYNPNSPLDLFQFIARNAVGTFLVGHMFQEG
jgi:hypothetical protein